MSAAITIAQIAAISENFALGKDNKLLWHFSEDLKRFKELTMNKVLIMGRKTFDSFPKPLPGRHHIVISRKSKFYIEQNKNDLVHFNDTFESSLLEARELIEKFSLNSEIMIIGGAEIYKQTLSHCDILYLTRIKGHFEADTFYPDYFAAEFNLTMTKPSALHTEQIVYQAWGRKNIITSNS